MEFQNTFLFQLQWGLWAHLQPLAPFFLCCKGYKVKYVGSHLEATAKDRMDMVIPSGAAQGNIAQKLKKEKFVLIFLFV